MINWMKFRFIYFAVSGVMIAVGVFGLIKWGLRLGIDFRGGTVLEYRLEKKVPAQELMQKIRDEEEIVSVQPSGGNNYILKFPPLTREQEDKVGEILKNNYGEIDKLRSELVGPSIGPDLVRKTVYAIIIAASAVLLWVAYQFKSIKFGASAVLAMLHDTFILIGSFSLLGHFFGAEADFLFVTAVLTTLSFSVHDTIVVFDRVREIRKKEGGDLTDLANIALTETMVRSLNNSFTIVFMLVALLLMGGITIRWFAAALLIGTILGTYSSPFVAVPLLVTWDKVATSLDKNK